MKVCVVDVSPVSSLAVAVIVRSNSPEWSWGGVICSPSSCSGVSVQEPSPLLTPALSVAPLGTLETVTESVSEPSVSLSADSMSRSMAPSSKPEASLVSRLGASATAPTLIVNSPGASDQTSPS